MLQVLLVVALVYCVLKCFNYKIGCYALTVLFLEHGAREPDDKEIEAYRQKVIGNIVRDILQKLS